MAFSRTAHWWALAAALAALAVHSHTLQPWTVDDAYIAFRYAENLARGNGPVFNVGERVEGYTTFLWVALLGGSARIGAGIETAAKTLGFAFAAATLLLLANAHRFAAGVDNRISAVAVVLLGACGFWSAWALGGLEVPMVGFFLLLALLLHARSLQRPGDARLGAAVGVACALAALSRPDALLVFGVLFAERLADGIRRGHRAWLPLGLAFGAIYAPYFVWRWAFYGWLLPNTFYAKVGGTWEQVERGLTYTTRFAGPAALLLAPVLAGIAFGGRLFRDTPAALALVLFAALHALYVIVVGGDALPSFRFFASIAPILCLLAAIALFAFAESPRRVAVAVVCIVAFSAFQSATHRDIRTRVVNGNVGRDGRLVGLWLRDHAPPDALLATNTAGSIPYFSKLRTVDMLGLNDAHIAHRDVDGMGAGVAGHEKGDGAYVLSRRPDYIQFGSARGQRIPKTLGDHEIAESEEFRRDYDLREHRLPSGMVLKLYERKAAAGGKPILMRGRD